MLFGVRMLRRSRENLSRKNKKPKKEKDVSQQNSVPDRHSARTGRVGRDRELSWSELASAQRYATLDQSPVMRAFGGEIVRAFHDAGKDDAEAKKKAEKLIKEQEETEEEKLGSYDTLYTLKEGIAAWSYDAPLDGETEKGDSLKEESIKLLDVTTADFVKKAIVNRSKGLTKEETKNS